MEQSKHGFVTFEGQDVPENWRLFNSRLLPTNTYDCAGKRSNLINVS